MEYLLGVLPSPLLFIVSESPIARLFLSKFRTEYTCCLNPFFSSAFLRVLFFFLMKFTNLRFITGCFPVNGTHKSVRLQRNTQFPHSWSWLVLIAEVWIFGISRDSMNNQIVFQNFLPFSYSCQNQYFKNCGRKAHIISNFNHFECIVQ